MVDCTKNILGKDKQLHRAGAIMNIFITYNVTEFILEIEIRPNKH